MMRNFRLELCYDGSRYRGWQRQGNTDRTIQGKLERILSEITDQPVEVHGAGRTDAGVHARMQVASFHAVTDLPCGALLSRLRAALPEDIGAISLTEAPVRFHARLNCSGKRYLYRVWTSAAPCVFERKYVWRRESAPDVAAMRRAAEYLTGTHDFAAFQTGRGRKSTVRRLDAVEIIQAENELQILYTGSGFLYNMVRILTGTLLAVGDGAISPEAIPEILESRDRANAGPTAPAQGLTLTEVMYE